jgi:hypothetical protein
LKKERAQPHDQGDLYGPETEYSEQHPGVPHWGAPDEAPTPALGWPLWLAWFIGLLAFFPTAVAGIALGLAALTSITLNTTLLKMVLLAPLIGGALALPAVIFALVATGRARRRGAGVAAPVTLVWLTTAVLVAGLLFGGLVAYPRYQLGIFGQTIQAHCARVAQSLQPYQGLTMSQLSMQVPALLATLQTDSANLPDDLTALHALQAPEPKYQRLLDDCIALAARDQRLIDSIHGDLIPPNPGAAQTALKQYQSDTSRPLAEIQQLGDELRLEVFAPFQPGQDG